MSFIYHGLDIPYLMRFFPITSLATSGGDIFYNQLSSHKTWRYHRLAPEGKEVLKFGMDSLDVPGMIKVIKINVVLHCKMYAKKKIYMVGIDE